MKNVIPVVMAGGEQSFIIIFSAEKSIRATISYPIHCSLLLIVFTFWHVENENYCGCISVIGIYGLIIAVILAESIPKPNVDTRANVYSIYTGMAHVSLFDDGFIIICVNHFSRLLYLN